MSNPSKISLLLFCFCLIFAFENSQAEVIAVRHTESEVVSASSTTLTFLWKGDFPKATLIMIPGGEGHIGLSMDRPDLGGFYGKTLKPLSNSKITSGIFNVVIFDSPNELPSSDGYPISRATVGHLSRIEGVVRFYKEKFHKPVWLMGHSNGAVSVTEFYKFLQKKHQEEIVSCIIYSSGRNNATFNSDTQVPVLFLAHENDRCPKSMKSSSFAVYNELIRTNKMKTEYVLIKSGRSESASPCRSGYHMFFEAHEEVYKAIDAFAAEILK
jgi:hypothetical protein